MTQRRLGRTSLSVSHLAYGLWRFVGADLPRAQGRIEAALEAGITLIDTAPVYGLDWGGSGYGEAEGLLGRVLQAAPRLRERLQIATKFGITPGVPYDSSPEAVVRSCEDSLRRMRLEVIDLFQVHRPDLLTHPAELAATLSALRQAGKIREAGVSNMPAAATRALLAHLPFPLASVQPEFSALHQAPLDDGVLDLCLETGMTPLAWSPLGGGRLGLPLGETRAMDDGGRIARVIEALEAVARARGVARVAVALAFLLRHPAAPIPILGSQDPARIAAAVAALSLTLTRAEWYAIAAAAAGRPLP